MIWLNVKQAEVNALYFDVQRVEARPGNGEIEYAVTGTLGDNQCETTVLVEVGERVVITFIDDLLETGDPANFFQRIDQEALETALAEAAAQMKFCVESFPSLAGNLRRKVTGYRGEGHWMALRPESYGEQLELPMTVAEPPAAWQYQVA